MRSIRAKEQSSRALEVGQAPSGVALVPDSRLIITADREDNQLSIIDAASFTRRSIVKVGQHPFGVTIDAPRHRVYAADVESDEVSVVDYEAGQLGRHGQGRQKALCHRFGARQGLS